MQEGAACQLGCFLKDGFAAIRWRCHLQMLAHPVYTMKYHEGTALALMLEFAFILHFLKQPICADVAQAQQIHDIRGSRFAAVLFG